jgi:hypothetical protein
MAGGRVGIVITPGQSGDELTLSRRYAPMAKVEAITK